LLNCVWNKRAVPLSEGELVVLVVPEEEPEVAGSLAFFQLLKVWMALTLMASLGTGFALWGGVTVSETSETQAEPFSPQDLMWRTWAPVGEATEASTEVPLIMVVSELLSSE
jgi:hypothetical protein